MNAHHGPRIAAGICLTLILATGCQSDATAPTEDAPVFGVNNGRPLPIKGWFEGSPLDANEVPWGHDFSVTCPAGYGHNNEVRGEGQLSHLGNIAIGATVCTRLTGLTATTIFLQLAGGQATFTAANGDLLITDVVGTAVAPRTCTGFTTYDVTLTILGGTGRFASAQGSMRWTGTQVPSPCPAGSTPPRLHVSFTSDEGTISNVGH